MNSARRRFLEGAITAGAAAAAGGEIMRLAKGIQDRRPAVSQVAILNQEDYGPRLYEELKRGIGLFGLNIKGKRVLLKPNLVEVDPGVEINTRPEIVGAAIEAFRHFGAAEVIVGEGPGHQRDTELVLVESGLDEVFRDSRSQFVDLNRDEVVEVPNRGGFTRLRSLWLPRTVVSADIVVSMPKVKTHHWVGVTLSMKNMFGVLPGSVYGWPKNVLHWEGIHESILDVCSTAPVHFVIADGIVAMEGNGPLHGTPRALGRVVLSDDLVAADFTCCRLMGLSAERVKYLNGASGFLGNGDDRIVRQIAENSRAPLAPFQIVPNAILH